MRPAATPAPLFSIVIPTYRRPDRLEGCIRSIAKLRYDPARFEVIVVDDGSGSADSVERVLAKFRDRLHVRLFEQAHRGPAAARNLGARRAAGRYLTFTDDDCQPDPGWLSALEDHYADSPQTIAGGRTINALRDNICAEASQALVSYLYEYYQRKGTPFIASNNLTLPRELFDELGGFDERFRLAGGEDRELCDRALRRGCCLAHVPQAMVHHYHALSLRGFLRQHLNYGRGAHFFHQTRAARYGGRIEVEPLTFYIDLIRYPLSCPQVEHRLTACLLMVVSQLANAAGFFQQKLWDVSIREYFRRRREPPA
ncbi:MAG: glycosyltransferase [Acidobacteriota bacterium]|nr:MAG: glycosyltransferase [Acidobacteriota bacterium]